MNGWDWTRVDILYAHDLDLFNHGSQQAVDARLQEFINGGYKALLRLRDEGVISAFGAGINEWEPAQWLAERCDFDIFLLAGRYTLLEQEAGKTFIPLCRERGIGVTIGGPYNSGILASGPRPGAFYDYSPAPAETLDRVARIDAICTGNGVRMIDAAFQFPLREPAVLSVMPGGQNVDEMKDNLRASQAEIPPGVWGGTVLGRVAGRRVILRFERGSIVVSPHAVDPSARDLSGDGTGRFSAIQTVNPVDNSFRVPVVLIQRWRCFLDCTKPMNVDVRRSPEKLNPISHFPNNQEIKPGSDGPPLHPNFVSIR